MSTKIQWTDETWNPVTGCEPTSEGCQNCYAQRMARRLNGRFGYPQGSGFDVTPHPDKLEVPLRWKKPRKIFVCSMGDLFHADISNMFIASVFGVMAQCPQHIFQVLTKRPERMLEWFKWVEKREGDGKRIFSADTREWRIHQLFLHHVSKHVSKYIRHPNARWPLPNVWLGVTAENQERADERISSLIHAPAAIRFVSCEPLLGPIDFSRLPYGDRLNAILIDVLRRKKGYVEDSLPFTVGAPTGIDWVICGGETGPKPRGMDGWWFVWARLIRDQCFNAGVPFFFKQSPGKVKTREDLLIREFPVVKP